jgi:hypothetical protein
MAQIHRSRNTIVKRASSILIILMPQAELGALAWSDPEQ